MPTSLDRLRAAISDRYEIEQELGRGAMATVYLARDVKHKRKVAIKVMAAEVGFALGPERFRREIDLASHLTHPHILPIYDSGEAEGELYYVMPYVEGESLRERLDRDHQLPIEEAVHHGRAIASALDYAHRNGIVHRRRDRRCRGHGATGRHAADLPLRGRLSARVRMGGAQPAALDPGSAGGQASRR